MRYLTGHGVNVRVESGAGENSYFSNHDYSEAGAEICYDRKTVFQSDVLLKVAPPTLEEIDLLQHNQILISPLQMPTLDSQYLSAGDRHGISPGIGWIIPDRQDHV